MIDEILNNLSQKDGASMESDKEAWHLFFENIQEYNYDQSRYLIDSFFKEEGV